APYYLDATKPLSSVWAGAGGSHLTWLNTTAVKTADQTMPLLLAVPNATSGQAKPAAGWPVVIFQHGITSDRTAMLPIADALASAGFAVVSIDMPLHGLPPGHPLRVVPGLAERTFDLDLVNNTTGAPGPDTAADSSGTHFINLSSLLTSRDNLRQAVADLFALHTALGSLDYDGGGADLDTSKVRFVGHSLGGMVGSVFLALEPTVGAGVLGMPGGGIAKLLDGSATFGPRLAAGLAANGVNKGTGDYESFFAVAQAAVDSADPINYAAATVTGRGVLLYRVKDDLVVPNNVLPTNPILPAKTVPSFLAGTDPLATLQGLLRTTATTAGANLRALVRFNAGDHASLLKPTSSAAVTSVMQSAAATFLATNGAQLTISDTSVVE
ncbi:MAG: alpha/beta hydrolase, partial [Deferrisomatales bacterium]